MPLPHLPKRYFWEQQVIRGPKGYAEVLTLRRKFFFGLFSEEYLKFAEIYKGPDTFERMGDWARAAAQAVWDLERDL